MKNVLFAWRNLILVIFLAAPTFVSAAEFQVSDSCKISLLTCSPGNELYSCFGHSGIRVNDPLERLILYLTMEHSILNDRVFM
jgi:hypothetical protein